MPKHFVLYSTRRGCCSSTVDWCYAYVTKNSPHENHRSRYLACNLVTAAIDRGGRGKRLAPSLASYFPSALSGTNTSESAFPTNKLSAKVFTPNASLRAAAPAGSRFSSVPERKKSPSWGTSGNVRSLESLKSKRLMRPRNLPLATTSAVM